MGIPWQQKTDFSDGGEFALVVLYASYNGLRTNNYYLYIIDIKVSMLAVLGNTLD